MGCTNQNITLYTYIVAEPRQGMRLSSVTDLFEVDRVRMSQVTGKVCTRGFALVDVTFNKYMYLKKIIDV